MRILLTVFFIVLYVTPFAQEKFTISGYIKDAASGESVIGATIKVVEPLQSVGSNLYGFYSLTLQKGQHQLTVSHVSYQTFDTIINLDGNVKLDFLLSAKPASMDEVRVYSRRRDDNVKTAQMGKIDLSVSQIKNIPAFLGEVDIMKTLQLVARCTQCR